MKRFGAIFCMIMIMFMMAPSASAAGFDIVKTSPKDGATDVPLENMGVKVIFNQDVYNKANEKENKKACKLVDSKGNEIDSVVVFNSKAKDVALVLAKMENKKGKDIKIKPTSDYKLVIDGSFKAANGDTLGETKQVDFTTLNPSTSMKISMGMMLVMVVGMVFASSKAMKKEEEKKNANHKKEEKFNPYKVAKETGKSVEEVLAIEKKRREKEAAKEAAKEARKAKHHHEEEEEVEEYMEPGHFKVKSVRTVAQGGSTYITGKKAEAEKKAAIEAKIRADKAAKKKGKKKKK